LDSSSSVKSTGDRLDEGMEAKPESGLFTFISSSLELEIDRISGGSFFRIVDGEE